jgi:cation transport ATPase
MNVLAVILSGFGIIIPMVGAVMLELSALPVLANSSRRKSYLGLKENRVTQVLFIYYD